jgi:hypothetical protein
MSTKFKYSYSKPLDGSRWKHLVAIFFDPDSDAMAEIYPDEGLAVYEDGDAGRRARGIYQPCSKGKPGDGDRDYLTQQKKFLKFMDESYGTQEKRWSVRWSDYGADVRFDSAADASSFVMCFTEKLSEIRGL